MIFDLLEIKDNDLKIFERKYFLIFLGMKENDFRFFFSEFFIFFLKLRKNNFLSKI